MRAFTTFTIKSISDEAREIVGIASTPSTDRMGDIVEPNGAKWTLPVPLLWQHDKNAPVGHVIEANATPSGIRVKARLTKFDEPGRLRDRLDEAWHSVKSGLVRGLSIGFIPLESEPLHSGGRRYKSWRWLELSAVTIPANGEATITAIKSADQAMQRAVRTAPVVYLNGGPRRAGAVYLK